MVSSSVQRCVSSGLFSSAITSSMHRSKGTPQTAASSGRTTRPDRRRVRRTCTPERPGRCRIVLRGLRRRYARTSESRRMSSPCGRIRRQPAFLAQAQGGRPVEDGEGYLQDHPFIGGLAAVRILSRCTDGVMVEKIAQAASRRVLIGRQVRQFVERQHRSVRVQAEDAAELVCDVIDQPTRHAATVLASRFLVSLSKLISAP